MRFDDVEDHIISYIYVNKFHRENWLNCFRVSPLLNLRNILLHDITKLLKYNKNFERIMSNLELLTWILFKQSNS